MSDRLTELHQEIHTILEKKFTELRKAVQHTEHTTREIVRTELSLQQHQEKQTHLQQELDALQQTSHQEKESLADLRKRHQSILTEREQLQLQKNDTLHQMEVAQQTNEEQQEQLNHLQQEHNALEEENNKLKIQIEFLQENIEKLRRLKEENLLSVMNLTAHMQEVSSGKD